MDYEAWTKEQLVRHISAMNQELLALHTAMEETSWLDHCLRERTKVLNERTKELGCIFRAVRTYRDPAYGRDEKLRRIVDSLPAAWLHSKFAAARAVLPGFEFATAGFRPTGDRLSASVPLRSGEGQLEICYLDGFPRSEGPLFLPEEENLVRVIAELLGAVWDSGGKG